MECSDTRDVVGSLVMTLLQIL